MGKEQDDATVTTSSSSSCKTKESLPRAQSNLEILSQTAAVVIEEGLCSAQTSPYPARVTPADTTSLLYSSVDAHPNSHCRKSFLSLPEMIGTTQHHHQPTIFLEQKRGFLPPAVQFELGSGGGVLAAGGSHESGVTEASSYYYSPGLFLSYSYGSTGTFGRGGAEPQPPEGSATGATATVSNNGGSSSEGSHNSNDSSVGGGANNHSAGDAATAAVHSFLDSAGSFSSGGGVSASSAASSSFHHLTGGGGGASLAASMQAAAAFVPPRPPLFQQQRVMALGGGASPSLFGEPPGIEFTDEAVRENFLLRQQLAARDATIDALQKQVEDLQQDIRELRQLPTGKISQIPLEYVFVDFACDKLMPFHKSYARYMIRFLTLILNCVNITQRHALHHARVWFGSFRDGHAPSQVLRSKGFGSKAVSSLESQLFGLV